MINHKTKSSLFEKYMAYNCLYLADYEAAQVLAPCERTEGSNKCHVIFIV